MGDSDHESNGPRREKFQRERGNDQYDRRGGRDRDWSRDRLD